MDDMVYNALRRKLAAAKATGDVDRINRIRAVMSVPEDVSPEAPAEIVEQPQVTDLPFNADADEITYPDTDE